MIIKIKGRHDFENAYKCLNIWKAKAKEIGENSNDWEFAQECKRDIREFNRKDDEYKAVHVASYAGKDYGDGFFELVKMPEDVKTREEAEDWFRCCEYREFYPSPYDCTGQWFTEFYHIFKRNGSWMAYHRIGIDL